MKLVLTFCILFSQSYLLAFEPKADDIIGIWWAPDKDGRIEIYKEGKKYFGKLAWTLPKLAKDLDNNNPDEKEAKKLLLGKTIFKNFKFDGDEWVDGTIYDPKNGKTYSAYMKMDEINKLNVRGYIGISLIGRTETFKKYKPQSEK